jgi:hypothetical protein
MCSLLFVRLVPRLKVLQFQLHFPELVDDCKPDMLAATAACQEVRKMNSCFPLNDKKSIPDQEFTKVLQNPGAYSSVWKHPQHRV